MDYKQNQDEPPISLLSWLNETCRLTPSIITPMPADAGARRYFRIQCGEQSFVAMDASNIKESCQSFMAIGKALRQLGLHTPEVLADDINQGYLLLTDFGDLTYLKYLNNLKKIKSLIANDINDTNDTEADNHYERALTALAVLHTCKEIPGHCLPRFEAKWMLQEWAWCQEWFFDKLLGLSLREDEKHALDDCVDQIIELIMSQPAVFMHRDYHSANLMVLNQNQVGILDFQDAFIGPVTYDVVSLLRDCYIHWPEEKVYQWALQYWRQLQEQGTLTNVSEKTFLHWFDWMGIERHLKALFTFARKYVRDQDARYLVHIPRTLNYVLQVSGRYPVLNDLHVYFQNYVQPAFLKVAPTCAR